MNKLTHCRQKLHKKASNYWKQNRHGAHFVVTDANFVVTDANFVVDNTNFVVDAGSLAIIRSSNNLTPIRYQASKPSLSQCWHIVDFRNKISGTIKFILNQNTKVSFKNTYIYLKMLSAKWW